MNNDETKVKIDRTAWGSGPWDNEPDRVEFRTAAGLPALIVRHPSSGHLCGYVAVNPGHPAYGHGYRTYYEKDAEGEDDYQRRLPNPIDDVRVHGGITYAERCEGDVCHVPAPGEPDDVWWLGFDMAHAGDLSSLGSLVDYPWSRHETYRTVEYVRGECERLAAQLAGMVP